MNEEHVIELLDHYLDGTISPEQQQRIERHIRSCPDCKKEFESLNAFLAKVEALPKEIQPSRDLWSGIEERIEKKSSARVFELEESANEQGKHRTATQQEIQQRIVAGSVWYFKAAAIMLVFIIGAGITWYLTLPELPSWQVTVLEGAPRLGSEAIISNGKFYIGDLLETDNNSKAKVTIGTIGEVTLDPNTKLRLLNASPKDHRLSLDKGTIHASVSAPPRLFVVETPSAKAVDLGCAYTLSVDSAGASTLYVVTGWVSLEHGGRESVVPQGSMCVTKSGMGPGTPFRKQASEVLRSALFKLDFENGGVSTLDTVLSIAGYSDAVTLWHLIFRVEKSEQGRVYDKLTALVPAPQGATREGVLREDGKMLQLWQNHLNLNPYAIVQVPVDAVPPATP